MMHCISLAILRTITNLCSCPQEQLRLRGCSMTRRSCTKMSRASANGRSSETAAIAQWRIGEMHFHKEQYKSAIDAYYRVDSLYDYPKWRSAAILQAGKCQEHLGNWKHAAKLYSQILEKYPNSELAASASQRLQLVNRQAAKPTAEKRR